MIFKCADILRSCGYEVCLFMDSDLPDEENDKNIQQNVYGVNVFDWEQGKAVEEQIFGDIPWIIAEKLLEIIIEENGIESVSAKLTFGGISHTIEDGKIVLAETETDTQLTIGTVAKAKKVNWWQIVKPRATLRARIPESVFSNPSIFSVLS